MKIIRNLTLCSFFFNTSRPDIPDVVSLIRRIHALESNLSDTKKRSEELLQQRRRVANKATSLLLNNHSQLSKLIGALLIVFNEDY